MLGMKKLRITPRSARYYLFFAILLIIAPTILIKFFPSHAGRVIVAAGKMNGSVFQQSVIYMSQHHAYLAMGFIINKPMPDDLKQHYQKRFPYIQHFHYGGPVGAEDEYYLLAPDESGVHGFTIYNGKLLQEYYPEKFNGLVGDKETAKSVRLFAGYAGWGAMQLNREIYKGWWDAIDFDESFISDAPNNENWNNAVNQVLKEKKNAIDAI